MEINKQVGIWIRVSTDKQGDSPEHHEARARAYAEWKGWEISKRYLLIDMSGKSIFDYPQTKEMLADVKSGLIQALVFSKVARVARNTRELLELSEIFKKHDATLVALDESIDTSTGAGMVYYTLLAALAEFELSEISARVSASIPIRAKLGKPIGGKASFGYKWYEGKFVINEEEAPVRKLMYELFLQIQRKKTTAMELNKRAYRTRNGSLFTDNTVDRLLRDTNAKGQRLANYTKSNGRGKTPLLKPKEEWIILPCPAIVDEDLWNKCNQILDAQRAKYKKPGPKSAHLLTGFVKCHCGTTMYVKTSRSYSCSTCRNRIGIEDIDEIYIEYLKGFLRDVNPTLYTDEATLALHEKEQLLIVANKKRAKVRKQMDELVPLRLNNELSKEHFAELYQPLEQQIKQFDTSIPELEAEIDFRKIQLASSDVVLMEARGLYEEWQDMKHEQKRAIVETITEHIIIHNDEIDIALCYLPSLKIAEKVDTSRWMWRLLPRYQLMVNKPYPSSYPAHPQTIGEHMRKRRMDLQLSQRKLAKLLRVHKESIAGWEGGRSIPMISYFPRITTFLGYSLWKFDTSTLGGKILDYRHREGLNADHFGTLVGVLGITVRNWELGKFKPYKKIVIKLNEVLDNIKPLD